jgi:hypothetical protein
MNIYKKHDRDKGTTTLKLTFLLVDPSLEMVPPVSTLSLKSFSGLENSSL